MNYSVIDTETDGLLDEVTKIHCLSYQTFIGKKLIKSGTITDYPSMIVFLESQEIIVGHNIIRFEIPLYKKILGIDIKCEVIDTIGISFYHYPVKNFKHGLGAWGERLNFGKPLVEDWKDQPIEVYINRCESDVEINVRLFHGQMDYTMSIYDGNLDNVRRIFRYLNFKLECLKDQEDLETGGITLDAELAKTSMSELEIIIDKKIESLSFSMPKELGTILFKKPKNPFKADGSLSHYGSIWFHKLEDLGLPGTTEVIRETPNPGSPTQLKSWLDSLGWIPETFKLNKKDENIAQVSLPFGAGLCPSVKKLFDNHPYLVDLDGLYKAQHRYGLFKSFIENVKSNGKIYSTAHGFTNTLRLQHSKPIVNLPGVDKWYGKQIRGCLKVANEDEIMCGSDVSGLEDNTKQHYIFIFDPQYVRDMRVPGFDPHIDIAVLAEMLTKEDEIYFKWYSDLDDKNKDNERNKLPPAYVFTKEEITRFKDIKTVRGSAKTVNFSATYGAGPPKIKTTLGCTLAFATKLHETYWKRNKAVKQTAKACIVKVVNGQKWLYNPISGFWLYLKAEKDRFSTLNQSSGVYFFDSWLAKVRKALKELNIKVLMQYHDELMFICKKTDKDICEQILKDAIKAANEEVKLNIEISISIDWGKNYSETH